VNGENFVTVGIVSDKLLDKLDKGKLNHEGGKEPETIFWQTMFATWLPMLVIVVLFLLFMRQLQVGGASSRINVENRIRFSSARWLLRICQIATNAKISVIQRRTVL